MIEVADRFRRILIALRGDFNTIERIASSHRREPHETKLLETCKQNVRIYLDHMAQEIERLASDEANSGKQEQGPTL